jgi:hypothetical protein
MRRKAGLTSMFFVLVRPWSQADSARELTAVPKLLSLKET